MFGLRIVTTDHYQATPIPGLDVLHSDFRSADVYKVPVIRIYGSTPAGQKTCMHVHGVFPYLYVLYDGTQPWDRYMRLFATSLDKAINVAQGQPSSNVQHVFKIVLVSGIPMYGFHPKEQQFLKIYFYNPGIIRKAADLLLGGAVMNKNFQPHESHIPYTLQMFIDYNLYGMNLINVAALKFRRKNRDDNGNPVDTENSQKSDELKFSPRTPVASLTDIIDTSVLKSPSATQLWDDDTIPSDMYMENEVIRQSVCELEVDIVAADILNRLEVDANVGTNPGLAALWEDERQRRRDNGESSQIEPPQSPERTDVQISDSDRDLSDTFREIVLAQREYMDSQSDVTSEDSQEGFPGSQSASMVDMHLSQSPEDYEGSQDTVMLEEEEEEDKPVPIVSLDSIKRVVSMSQSFSLPSSGPSDENEDRSLAQILASLADESSPPSSQAAASQVSVLEEKDSILLEKPIIPDDEVVQNDEQETLEMSQVVWDDGSQGQEDKTLGEGEQFDLAGLDSTWNDSQMPAHKVEEDYDSPTIPQLDGASDEKPKPAQKRVRKKRLGTNGPVSTFDQMVAEARKHGVDVNNIQRPGMYGNPPNMMSGMGPRMNQPAFNPMHSGFQNQNFGNYGNNVRGNLDWTSQNPRPQLGGNQWNPNQQMPWTQMLNSPDEMPNYMVNARPSLDGNNSQQGLSSPQGMNLSMSQQTVRSPQGQLSPHGSMASPQGVPSSTERSPYQRGAPSNTSVNPPHCFPSPLGKTSSDQVPSSPVPGGQLEVRNTSQEMVSPGAMRSPSTAVRPPTETISSPNNPPLSSSVQSQPINMTSSSFNHQGVTHSGSQISSSSGLNASYDSASPHRLSASDVSSPHSNMSSHGSVSSPHNSLQSPVGQIRNPNNMNSIYNNTMNTSNPQYSPAQEQLSPMGNNSSWESSQSYLEQLNGFQNQYQSPFTMSQQQPSQHMQPASYPVDQYHPFPVQQYHSQQQSQGAQQQMTSSQELDLSRNYTSPVSQASHSYGSNTAERDSYQLNSNQSGNIDYSPSSLQQSNRSHVSSPSSQMYGINLSKRSESASSLGPQNDSSMNRRPSFSSGHSNSRSSFNDSQMEHSNSSMPEEQVLNNSQPVPLPTSISDPTKGNSSLLNSLQEAFNFAGNHLRDMNSSQSSTSFSQSSGGPGFGTGNGGMMGQQQNSNMGNRGMMGQQQNSNMGNSYQSQTINSTSQVYQRQVSAEGMHSNQGDRNQMSGNYQGQPGQFHMQTNSFGDSGGIMHQNTGGHMSSVTYNQGGSSYYGNYGMPQSNSQMPQNTYGSGGYYPPQQSGYGQDGTMIQNYGMPGPGQPHGNDGKTLKQRKPRKPREKKEKVPGETKKRAYKKRTSFMCVDPAKSVVPTGQTQEGKNLLEKLLLAPEEEEERIANSAMLDRNGCSDRSQSSSNSNVPSSYAQNQSQSSSSLLSSTSSTSENITKDFCSDHSKGNSSVSALSHTGNTCNNISESLHSNVGIPPNTNDSLTVQVEKKRRGRPPKNSSIRSLQNFVSTHKTQYGMKVTKIATEGKFKQRSSPKLVKFSDLDQSQRTAQTDLMNRDPTVYLPDDDNLSPTYMTLDDSFNSGYNKPTSVEELLVQRSRLDSYVDPESKILHRYSIDTDKSPANDESVKKKKGKLVRSLSTPEPGKKRRGRPPKNPELKAAERMRSLSTVSEISDMDDFKIRKPRKKAKAKNSTSDKYTFVFHIPSYSFKKVKLIDMGRLRQDLGFVRMHPMDARRYSLLKVGRELVRIPKLSMQHIAMGKMGQTEDLQELLKMSGVDVMMKRKSSMIGYEAETQALMEAIEKENLTKISNTTKDNVEVMVVQEKQRLSEIIPETNCFNIEKVALSSIIDHCLKTNIGVENSDSDSVVKADVSESPSTGCEVRTYSSGTVLDSAHTSNTTCQGHQGNQENSKSESNGVETSCRTIEELMEKKIKESNGIVNDQEQQQGLPNDTLSKVSDVPASSKVSDVPASSNVSDQPTEVQSEDKQEKASDIVSKAPNNVITPATSQFQPLVSETGSQKKECGPDKAKDASRSKVRKERKYSAKTIRKQNKLKLHKKLPLVIDPDQEEHDDVILHDVSLLEASDGRLTPVRSRTPITGRSPIRPNYNPDQYQLVGADILCSKDDLDNKWKMSDIGSDGASVTSKSDSQSRSSSRTNSECDSTTEEKLDKREATSNIDEPDTMLDNNVQSSGDNVKTNCDGENNKDDLMLEKINAQKTTNQKSDNRCRSGSDSQNITKVSSQNSQRSEDTSNELCSVNEAKNAVHLSNTETAGTELTLSSDSQNIQSACSQNLHVKKVSPPFVSVFNDEENQPNVKSADTRLELGKEPLSDTNAAPRYPQVTTETSRMSSSSEASQQKIETSESKEGDGMIKSVTSALNRDVERLRTRSRSRSQSPVVTKSSENQPCAHSKAKSTKSRNLTSRSRSSSVSSTNSELKGNMSESDSRKSTKKSNDQKEKQVPGVDYLVTGRFRGQRVMTVLLKKLDINSKSVKLGDLGISGLNYLNGKNSVSNLSKPLDCGNVIRKLHDENSEPFNDESSLDSLFSGPKKSRLSLFKRKELEVIEISSSEDSNLEPPVNKKLVVNVENALNSNILDNTEDPIIEINDSNSDLDSSISKGDKLFSNKRKKKLTKSQRLHMAFNSASYKTRRKRSPVHSGKLMANLSLLHQATLANLNDNENENMEGYGDCLDDYKAPYEDAMFKMSLLSPHSSEAGDMSPPQPLSPGEVSGDVCAAMRSTSEVLSPVISTTSNSSPISSLTGSDMSPVYPPTAVNCVDNYNLAVDESPLKTPSYAQGVTPERRDVSAKRKILDDGVVDSRDNFPVNEICSPQSNTSVVDESCIAQNSDQSGTNVTNNTKCTSSSQDEEIEEIQCKNTDDLSSSDKNGKLEGKDEIVRTKELTQSEESDSDNVIQSSQECTDSRATSKFDTMKNCSSVRTSIPSTSGMNLRENDGSISDNTEDKRLCRKRKFEVRHTERKAVVKLKPLSVNEIEKYSSFSKDVCSPDNTLSVSSCENQMEQCDSLSQSGDQSLFSDSAMMLSPGNSSQGGEVPLNDDMDTEIKGTSSVKNAEKLGSGTANSRSNSQNSNSPPNPRASSIGLTLSRGNQKLVYMPSRRPPSRESVTKTAVSYGLGTSVNQDAFYSNPDDAMEKPKEVGGRLLSVQSSRVRELPEFEHSIDCTGLTTVRKIIASENNILDSQIDNESLFERLSKDLDFKFALFGDRTVTIAPVKPPPSKSLVELWIQKHDIYKDLKLKINGKANSSVKKDEKKEKCCESVKNSSDNKNRKSALKIVHKEKSYSRQSSFGSECKLQTSKSEPTREVSFDEKVEKFSLTKSVSDSEVSEDLTRHLASDRIDLCSTTNQKKDEIDDKMDEKIDEMDDDIISPSPPKSPIRSIPKDKLYMSHSMAKRIKLNIEDQSVSPSVSIAGTYTSLKNPGNLNASTPKSTSSSTPLRIKRLDKLFQASFTPIAKNQSQGEPSTVKQESDTKKGKDTGFLTPKKIPLPRRLSINSVNRKLIPSGQDYSTPRNQKDMSQIDGPTPKNSFGFKVSQQNLQDAKALHEVQNLTVISLELHAETRRDLRPDPEVDSVQALFYVIHHEVKDADPEKIKGAIIVHPKSATHQYTKKLRQSGSSEPAGSKVIQSSPQPSTSRSRSPQPSTSRAMSPQPSTSKDTSQPKTSPGGPGSKVKTTPQKGKRSKSRSPSPRPPRSLKDTDYIEDTLLEKSGVNGDLKVTYVDSEEMLFDEILKLISRWDPDILVGFEIQNFSWGYLLQRASHLSINLCALMSRIPEDKRKSSFKVESDEWGADHSSEIHIAGRIILNLWRLMRHEVALNIYTYENIAFHVLHERIPHFSFQTLSSWFNHRTHLYRWRFIQYYLTRVEGNMRIIDQLDLIGRTSEFARVFGIEFYHVLSRGSQYRVESMMLRLAKPMNFIPVSPSVNQRARMKAPECIALTLEPESRFYPDPVIVLDFQSLYPSIMIAHNYCFSTCVGRLDYLKKAYDGPIEFGCTNLRITPSTLDKIKDHVTVSPNGVVFVKKHIRKGIISSMVDEILNTRIMVKKSMKEYKKDKGLQRLLDARQLGLKLIANVTYGYTGANFSGRMPCIEVGDSIVRKARETLERAIQLVEDTPRWGAKVVYGDTDSMFIELKGRSKDEAFVIGQEICDAVTAMNPKPIKLKFEKVYLPCVLQTKKRYVGYSYETPDQKEPVYDAKGIETVRRDSCSAVSKILERTIKILFTSRDVSQVKEYILKQCTKLMQGKVSMQDCIFAKEYRGMKGYKPGACVPALEIAKKLLRNDRRAEPRVGERVPYVIVYGSPGLPLIMLVRQPQELLQDPSLRINATYYITKQILPPLDRLLSLLGVDVFSWYNDMPKVVRVLPQSLMPAEKKKGTISQFFSTVNCPVCDKLTNQTICNNCMQNPQMVCVNLCDRITKWEKVHQTLIQICNTCMGVQDERQPCDSLDCPIMFRRVLAKQDNHKADQLRVTLEKALEF